MSWEGFGVSVRCGALGCYQGTIAAATGDSITLTKPFRNGFPYPKAQVTLKASDIKSLEIISERAEATPAHSTVVAGGRRRGARASVGESLQPPAPAPASAPAPAPAPASAPAPAPAPAPAGKPRSKPIDIQGARPARHNTHSGSYGGSGGAGGAGSAARRRNEACFGAGALDDLAQDFDFEGNLALFDKEALRQQLRPDVVRVAAARDEAAARLRPDQSVLPAAPPDPEPVHVPPELRGAAWYATDGGARVPSLGARARRAAWRALAAGGAGPGAEGGAGGAARVLLARAAADVALRLVGGGRRLEPRNAHQRPAAAVAVRRGPAAAAAVEAARLLQSHGVETYVIAPPAGAGECARVADALRTYAAAGGRVLRGAAGAGAGAGAGGEGAGARPDLLLLALHDPEAADDLDDYGSELIEWALSMRSTLLLLEPGGAEEEAEAGAEGEEGPWARAAAAARASVVAILPPAGRARALLLANVAPPPRALAALGLRYRPPFGAAALLPLHPA